METVTPTPLEQAQLAAGAAVLERYVTGPAALAVARRAAFYGSLRASLAAAHGRLPAPIVSAAAAAMAAHTQADATAAQYAQLIAALRAGQLELAPWVLQSERGTSQPRFGVVRTGGLGLFPVVPVLIVAATAIVAGGAWLLGDLYLHARMVEAQADKLRADTAAQITTAVAALSATDPQAATALADALARANNAANAATPSWLDRLAGLAGASTGSTFAALAIAAVLFVWSRRKS